MTQRDTGPASIDRGPVSFCFCYRFLTIVMPAKPYHIVPVRIVPAAETMNQILALVILFRVKSKD